jgi:hypothetical protein
VKCVNENLRIAIFDKLPFLSSCRPASGPRDLVPGGGAGQGPSWLALLPGEEAGEGLLAPWLEVPGYATAR